MLMDLTDTHDTTIGSMRKHATAYLHASLSKKLKTYTHTEAALDVDIILQHSLRQPRSYLLSHPETPLSPQQTTHIRQALTLRSSGLAIAYITQQKEFFGLPFFVNTDVLIPKPDTETLVETALLSLTPPFAHPFRILDTCCGSGCIGISLAKNLVSSIIKNGVHYNNLILSTDSAKRAVFTKKPHTPAIELICQDISPQALSVASYNAHTLLHAERAKGSICVHFDLADASRPYSQTDYFDCITANPPYIPRALVERLLQDGRGEPGLALDGGLDGLHLYAAIAKNCYTSLKPNGSVFIEAGEYNIAKASMLFAEAGFKQIRIFNDITGAPRLFSARK